ncbi:MULTISPECIES: AraC family transcriptional regulator [Clostridium]|uniref:AraC family transcriptional regulator n=1 Tax=Clostridium aquiflavi TaxID=3073603 RepID=A0ABU1EG38_9CLOT|nr:MULTISPECIES: AraC family transcriptional regulator [unclassified Clostridium]MDR5587355.1 AraC family transcriptional regulator [Clostridium sp. 5N-1]NFG62005.1 helix-turn-helix transcriptional regulator [Clostridium botulinum]NFQ08327.1 helix-turn-helix transcriptional regulator [Clostridium botulinum]
MRSLDKDFFKQIIGERICKKDSIIYKIASQAGEGTMQSFKVMPGIELIYNDLKLKNPIKNMMNVETNCVEITYCLKGQVEIKFGNEKYAYMADGDISLFGYQTKAISCDFSLKHFVGIRVMIYIDEFLQNLNIMLGTNEFKGDTFFKNVFCSDRCIITHGNQSIHHIFKELYVLPDEYKNYLMKIKVVELILYLISGTDYKKNETIYFSKTSVEKIKEARKIILSKVDQFITIKSLSRMVGMNTTDLEKGFKSIYGYTIFSYSKMYKMKKAKELISNEKIPILEISLLCGYSNGSKFAKAFRETFGVLPTQYRKEMSASK